MQQAEARKHEQQVPIGELFRKSRKEVLFGFLSVTGHNANVYILNTFSIGYMFNTVGMARSDALIAVTIGALFGVLGVPLFGVLADRISAAKVYVGGCLFILAMAFPLFMLLDTGSLFLATLGISLCFFGGFGATSGAQGAFLSNLFPTRYRFSGLAMSRELNGVMVAGPTPLIAASLVSAAGGRPTYVALYLMACCALAIMAIVIVKSRSVHE